MNSLLSFYTKKWQLPSSNWKESILNRKESILTSSEGFHVLTVGYMFKSKPILEFNSQNGVTFENRTGRAVSA